MMPYTVPGVNTRQFIKEVRKRPAIWNADSNEYSDRDKRKEAWEELTLIFMSGDEASEFERDRFARNLQRRWKNLRDCFTRELLKKRKSLAEGKTSGKGGYIYFNQLSFLKNVVRSHKKIFRETVETEIKSNMIKKDKVKKPADMTNDVDLQEEQNKNSDPLDPDDYTINEVDCDKLFLLSLLKPLKDVPEELRFGVKLDIMRVIQDSKKNSKQEVGSFSMKREVSSPMSDEGSMDSIKEPPTPTLSYVSEDAEDI